MGDTTGRQRLLTAAVGTDMVQISYGEAVRAALLVGMYESAWDEDSVLSALEWWLALRPVFAKRPEWEFTLRDFEPAWIREGEGEDVSTVTVGADEAGRIRYEIHSSRDGEESAVTCPAVIELENLLDTQSGSVLLNLREWRQT